MTFFLPWKAARVDDGWNTATFWLWTMSKVWRGASVRLRDKADRACGKSPLSYEPKTESALDCWSVILHTRAHGMLASCNLGFVPHPWCPQSREDGLIRPAVSFTKEQVQSGWCKQSLQADCGTLFLPEEYLRVSRIVLCWNSVFSSGELYTVCTSTSFEHFTVNVCTSASECEVISLERKYY